MSWTTPMTFTVGQKLTAAQMNTYVRDNSNFLFSPPSAKAHKTADQGIANNSWSNTAFGALNWDTDSIVTLGTGLFNFNTAGVYECGGQMEWAASTGGVRMARLNETSGTIIAQDIDSNPSGGFSSYLNVSSQDLMGTSDTLKLEGYQNSGGNLDIVGSDLALGYSMWVTWIGAGT